MSDVLSTLLQGTTLRVTTSLTPAYEVDLGDATASGPPNPITAWLKPEVELVSGGAVLQKWAPYGEPTPPNYWVLAGGVVVVFVLAFLLVTNLQRG